MSLAVYLDVRGPDRIDTLNSIVHLAMICRKQGKWKEAQKLYKRTLYLRDLVQAVENSKAALGFDLSDTLWAMTHPGITYTERGRLEETEELQLQVAEKRRTLLRSTHSATLAAQKNPAVTYPQI
ncbi:Tetratricopeptide repeat-domain-containing protein [Xylariaceae sp. FL1019]|nr:Tetratricopeptide repeat-domain-containing protein [Xylariaceae sp. FL1019]